MSQQPIYEAEKYAPVVYEILASVEADIAEEFTSYMVEIHVPDLLKTGHFSSALIARSGDRLRISYLAKSQRELELYIEGDAPRLRAEVIERFPSGFQIERTEWDLLGVLRPA